MRICTLIMGISLVASTLHAADSGQQFSLNLDAVHATVQSGDDVTVKVTNTNITDHDISFSATNPECDFSLDVRYDSGALIPITAYKRALTKCENASRRMLVTLKPQESFEEVIVVSKLNDMTKPGTYTIQVLRRIPRFGPAVKSALLKIDVR